MSLKDIDLDAALRRLADKRIDDAMREGKFDNLPGHGQPIVIDDAPAEENARLMWWALRILKNNDVIPDEIRWRKTIDHLRVELHKTTDEQRLAVLVGQINALVHKLNTLGTNALRTDGFVPLDLDAERRRLRQRLASPNLAR
jgi:hypothetical protein